MWPLLHQEPFLSAEMLHKPVKRIFPRAVKSESGRLLRNFLFSRRAAKMCIRDRCRAGRHHPPVLHVRTSTSEAPPQPPERHADLPGAGIQRSDYPPQAGFGQACPHHAELPSGRQTDRQGRSARCADLRPCAVCKPSTYALEITHRLKPVSYTHLDVYKRQGTICTIDLQKGADDS